MAVCDIQPAVFVSCNYTELVWVQEFFQLQDSVVHVDAAEFCDAVTAVAMQDQAKFAVDLVHQVKEELGGTKQPQSIIFF